MGYCLPQKLSKRLQNARARMQIYGEGHSTGFHNDARFSKAKAELDSLSLKLNVSNALFGGVSNLFESRGIYVVS